VEVLVMPQYLSVTIVREQFQEIGIEVSDDLTIEQAKSFIRTHIEEIERQLCYDTDWMVDSIEAERILPITEEAAISLGMCTWDEIAECDKST